MYYIVVDLALPSQLQLRRIDLNCHFTTETTRQEIIEKIFVALKYNILIGLVGHSMHIKILM